MRPLLLCCLLLTIVGAGCGSTRSGRETAVAVTVRAYETNHDSIRASANTSFLSQLDVAEQKWQCLGIANYRITVSKGNLYGGPQRNTITVTNGKS